MISVDNFYKIFQSHYGWDKKKVLTWFFPEHGSKCFYDLVELHQWTSPDIDRSSEERLAFYLGGCVIHHDQEIFLPSSLDTYKSRRYQIKNNPYWLDQIPAEDIIIQHVKTLSWPIICHSEIDSPGVGWLERQGFIPCYYFWHGIVARDWFRHWKHHAALQTPNLEWQKRFLLYARDHKGLRTYRKKLVKNLIPFKDQILYNWQGLEPVTADFSAKIVVQDAVDTAIHLVAETAFDLDRIHATEKVFKPMVMRQPFIVFAGAGMLEYLRGYGFKTFGDIWDESYDQEMDHGKRMSKILSLVDHLHSMDDTEFRDTMSRCQDILDHNRRHFFSDEFEAHLMEELHQNVSVALELQEIKIQQDPGGSWFYFFKKYCIDKQDYPRTGIEVERMIKILEMLAQQDPDRLQQILEQHPWARQFYR